MYANNRTRRKWNQVLLFLVSCHFVKYSISSPIFSSQFSQCKYAELLSRRRQKSPQETTKKNEAKRSSSLILNLMQCNYIIISFFLHEFNWRSWTKSKGKISLMSMSRGIHALRLEEITSRKIVFMFHCSMLLTRKKQLKNSFSSQVRNSSKPGASLDR